MKEIQLSQGKVALVDDDDFERLNKFKWCALKNSRGYYAVRTCYKHGKRTVFMHKEILNAKDLLTDHIDHDCLNNQKHNLRLATGAQNNRNKISARNSRSRFKGVYLSKCKHNGRLYTYWRASIAADGKVYNLGNHDNEVDAAMAYNTAAIKFHGYFAHLNDIPV